jgi:L-carnitine CoA-transferase
MAKRSDIPEFGVLNGVKVVVSAASVAGPFCGTLCADHGADVILIEQSKVPNTERSGDGMMVQQDRKNMRFLALDVPSAEGRNVLFKMLKDTDIFVESSKGGSFAKWGITDELLWGVNPRLVIVHISGFGQYGDPDYVSRASYDTIAQAFSGMVYVNSKPGIKPEQTSPLTADYITGLFAYGSALAAYINVLKTGKGESVDLSQYEAVLRCMHAYGMKDWNWPEGHQLRFHPGATNGGTAGYNTYLCKDGKYVYMLIFGPTVMRKAFELFGIEYGSEEFPKKPRYVVWDPEGAKLEKIIEEYCMKYTAKEVEQNLNAVNAPCICMMEFTDMLEHPHYKARESIIKFNSEKFGREIYMSNIVPKMKNNPGKMWRQVQDWGTDTADILNELGYNTQEIAKLEEDGIIHTAI